MYIDEHIYRRGAQWSRVNRKSQLHQLASSRRKTLQTHRTRRRLPTSQPRGATGDQTPKMARAVNTLNTRQDRLRSTTSGSTVTSAALAKVICISPARNYLGSWFL